MPKCNCTPVRLAARTVASISSNDASTKTPILSSRAGNCDVMTAACAAVMRRGLGAKTKPMASAPASAAANASERLVVPQILIQGFIGLSHDGDPGDQLG